MYPKLFKKRPRDDTKDLKPVASSSGSSASSGSGQPRTIYHYPSHLPFPVVMTEDFPAEAYRSRNGEVKTAVHWGQRKLLLSEIQLLCMYTRRDVAYHIIYAGSAPGTHLGFLDDMFRCQHTWELIDPGHFDRVVLDPRQNFTLRNEFFTNATAYGINARRVKEVFPALGAVYSFVAVESVRTEKREIHEQLQSIVGTLDVARGTHDIPSMYETPLDLPKGLELLAYVAMERAKPLLFVSDIRSGSVGHSNFEDHVAENMKAQACWTSILQAEHSMLKFRLPYTRTASGPGGANAVKSTLIDEDGCVSYLRGDIVLPIWTRPTSTEGRLVVPRGALDVKYNVAHVEDQFFFFNTRVRETVHFNHLLHADVDLDHHFDGAAEVHCLELYTRFMEPSNADLPPHILAKKVKAVSDSITKHLQLTFADAIRRRDAIILHQARTGRGGIKLGQGDDDDDDDNDGMEEENEYFATHPSSDANGNSTSNTSKAPVQNWAGEAQRLIEAAAKERLRLPWRINIQESTTDGASGFWVTTVMRQT